MATVVKKSYAVQCLIFLSFFLHERYVDKVVDNSCNILHNPKNVCPTLVDKNLFTKVVTNKNHSNIVLPVSYLQLRCPCHNPC